MSWLKPLNPQLEDWRGKTAWVVGASSGIGRATALALIARGARVAVSARSREGLDSLAAESAVGLKNAGSGDGACVIVLPFDVTDRDAVAEAHARLEATAPIDFVLCCAGTYKPLRAVDFDLQTMLAHQQVNYVGVLNVLDAVLPSMIARGAGHIALTASVAGFRGLPQSLAYGPTKAALTNLAEVLHTDLEPRGIGVSVVQPGFVETPLTAQNEFKMPALITPAQAADKMLQGWARGAFEIHFPFRFTFWMKLLRIVPYRLYFAAVRRVTGL
ncbi:MAG: SDR family NAD(P)-dependent oxidoreductase [Gammaproteobacteria bacterium]|nr:SDR family NAD(P)-dependent oxidoreductase [Gammaproteobacteria bacterium]MBU1440673.1 SDR family NAD(P)-dependent oxidoreductase [Gammaproteobacteria bacterium]MBU2287371.1 SDR family NAD(P)-dependent oxidoreductase [Gammaproteobacteria bacterium]MBU2408083.1 SDR family NAD(P)-dependent oxidoreductase [Gammaproteobacteria bacterium]